MGPLPRHSTRNSLVATNRSDHGFTGNGLLLKTTRYFDEQVLRKRPDIERRWCLEVLAAPIRREAQTDGRIRFWGRISAAGRERYLRVVTLEDGETIHNAFFDRNFREEES